MEKLGKTLIELGFRIIPYSFAFYLPTRLLEYKWKKGYSRLVKGIWYICLGMLYLIGSLKVDIVVMYICFIEAIDLIFQQLEINRKRE